MIQNLTTPIKIIFLPRNSEKHLLSFSIVHMMSFGKFPSVVLYASPEAISKT